MSVSSQPFTGNCYHSLLRLGKVRRPRQRAYLSILASDVDDQCGAGGYFADGSEEHNADRSSSRRHGYVYNTFRVKVIIYTKLRLYGTP